MNTAKIIEEIQQLPSAEKEKVFQFLLEESAVSYVKTDEKVAMLAERVFSEQSRLFKKLAQ